MEGLLRTAAESAQAARELREQGHSQREIAEALGVHRTTVYRMLHERGATNQRKIDPQGESVPTPDS